MVSRRALVEAVTNELTEVFLYVQGRNVRGYLMPDDSIQPASAFPPRPRRFESIDAARAEVKRRGWTYDATAWEDGATKAFACWAYS